jgi:hypothetical protein
MNAQVFFMCCPPPIRHGGFPHKVREAPYSYYRKSTIFFVTRSFPQTNLQK